MTTNGASEETLDFQPVTFDASELPPEASPGSYEMTCTKVKVTSTAKDKYPMVIAEWTLDTAVTGNEQSVGATIADFLTFFPQGHKAYRMCVSRVRGLLDALGLDPEIIPQEITSKSDFDGLTEALENAKLTGYITLQTDKRSGGKRAVVGYAAPKGDEEEEEEAAKKLAKKPAKKNGRR